MLPASWGDKSLRWFEYVIVTAVADLLVHCFGALEHCQATGYTPAPEIHQQAVPRDPLAGYRAVNRPNSTLCLGIAKRMDLFIEFFIEQWVLFLALGASFVMLFLHESRKAGPAATPQQAISLVNSDEGVFLDIRDGSDYKKGHIADSVHIPLAQLPTRQDELTKYKQKPIIVVCKMGQTAGPATRQLREAGFERAQKMTGGMMEWTALKLPIVSK
ncbi:MAG: rhodanese-like domain-containing protein [Luminiphilus sp.]